MKKVVLLAIILAMCWTSYGTVLVYKQTVSINPMVTFTDANAISGTVGKITLQTYVVFDVNTTTYDVNIPADINNRPTAIIFGTFTNVIYKFKDQMTLGGHEPNNLNSFVDISGTKDGNSIKPFNVLNKKNTSGTLLTIDIRQVTDGFRLFSEMYGINTSIVINPVTKAKVSLAKSLKGDADIDSSPLLTGFGLAKATLDPKYTKFANAASGKTVKQVVTQIQADLQKQKFNMVDKLPGFPCLCEQ